MAMDQHYLVFPSQFVAGQQSILCRTPHIQAGDDVQNLGHGLLAQMSRDGPVTQRLQLNLQSNSELQKIGPLNTLTNPAML